MVARELAQMINLRFTEVLSRHVHSLAEMILVQECVAFVFPIDQLTDCMDMWELVAGEKPVPLDRTHRLYILSLREERAQHGIRFWIKVPTE